jgi:hypothetical protein
MVENLSLALRMLETYFNSKLGSQNVKLVSDSIPCHMKIRPFWNPAPENRFHMPLDVLVTCVQNHVKIILEPFDLYHDQVVMMGVPYVRIHSSTNSKSGESVEKPSLLTDPKFIICYISIHRTDFD